MSKPCIHGNLCRAYLNKFGRIFSNTCPANCKFYAPLPQSEPYTSFYWNNNNRKYYCKLYCEDENFIRIDIEDLGLIRVSTRYIEDFFNNIINDRLKSAWKEGQYVSRF